MVVEQCIPAVYSAWIDRYGNFFPVEYTGHWNFAVSQWKVIDPARDYSVRGYPVTDLENEGWLHISNSDHSDTCSVVVKKKINGQQFDTLFDWMMAHKSAGNERFAQSIREFVNRQVELQ